MRLLRAVLPVTFVLLALPISTRAQSTAGSPAVKCTPHNGECTIGSGFTLKAGESLQMGTTKLAMQTDGNLVLYQAGGGPLWASGQLTARDASDFTGSTQGMRCPHCFAAFQMDGNLVLYNPDSSSAAHSYWATGTDGHAGAALRVSPQNDLAIVDATGKVLWHATADVPYLGATKSVLLNPPGCNATAFAQLPGASDLFLGRQLLTADGHLSGISGPNDCSGGDPNNEKTGKVFNRWGLVLDRLDWKTHRFSIVKPLLDTSLNPTTHVSSARITGGRMSGAIIRSAYDPDIAVYHGQILVSFECTLENEQQFAVQGTSSCVSAYDPSTQSLDLRRTTVAVSGTHNAQRLFAAAVPKLLVFQDRLFLYWAVLGHETGRPDLSTVRGVELEWNGEEIKIKGGTDHILYSVDPQTTEVWAPNPEDALSNSAVDPHGFRVSGNSIVAYGGLGGSGCVAPTPIPKGCFRLAIVRAQNPLGDHVFNHGQSMPAMKLPTNPQEYTAPIQDPDGNYWLMGHFISPSTNNGLSELRPLPGGDFWKSSKQDSVLVMFPVDSLSPY
jgi:hypothetical protein